MNIEAVKKVLNDMKAAVAALNEAAAKNVDDGNMYVEDLESYVNELDEAVNGINKA